MATTRTTSHRIVTWTAAVLVVGALSYVAFRPQPVAVDAARVTRGALQVTVDREGKTRVHDRYVVSAPVAGRVHRIDLRPGDAVVAGRTVVATFVPGAPPLLDSRTRAEATARVGTAEAALSQARAVLSEAQAQQTLTEKQRDRTTSLFKEQVASRSDVDIAEADARARAGATRAAEAAVRAAEHELEVARATVARSTLTSADAGRELIIRAPVSGVVLQRLHESEAVVPMGEPLVDIADSTKLEVVADYLSTDAVRIRPGMAAIIDRWGGEAPLRARVVQVEPFGFLKISALGVEEQRVNVILKIEDPPAAWASLGDGYRVEVRVVLWEGAGVLKVPTSALFRHGADWAVFAIDNGRARLRILTIGERTGVEAQVLLGVTENDAVIVHPADSVAEGVHVQMRKPVSG